MLEEFKKFAMRGNVVDLAVGVIIGAAFGAIVNSLVNDIVMPLISAVSGGLAVNGTLMIIGAVPSLQVAPLQLLTYRQSVKGWYSGMAIDSQDTLAFSVLSGVRAMNEVYPLEKAAEAYERMMSGKARFRVVLTTGN